MKKRFMIVAALLSLVFASVSSVSALAATGEPIVKEKFAVVETSNVIEPEYVPALVAIANAARVANAVTKAAKGAGAAVAGGFLAAAGADAYSRVTGNSTNYNAGVSAAAEVVFD